MLSQAQSQQKPGLTCTKNGQIRTKMKGKLSISKEGFNPKQHNCNQGIPKKQDNVPTPSWGSCWRWIPRKSKHKTQFKAQNWEFTRLKCKNKPDLQSGATINKVQLPWDWMILSLAVFTQKPSWKTSQHTRNLYFPALQPSGGFWRFYFPKLQGLIF